MVRELLEAKEKTESQKIYRCITNRIYKLAETEIPVIHPVVDYFHTFDKPILGGEAGFRMNMTSLSRTNVAFAALPRAYGGARRNA